MSLPSSRGQRPLARSRAVVAALAALAVTFAACGADDPDPGPEPVAADEEPAPEGDETETPEGSTELEKLTFQLAWFHQGEFAGFYVADQKGYYADEGLEIEWLVGGPDVQAARNIATGIADLGEATVPQILSARSLGVPITSVFQHQQTTVNYYLARADSGIETFEDVVGKQVGLWFGGLELEFLGILAELGIDQDDVDIFGQGFTIVPWLEGEYDVMQVVPWNEYQQAVNAVGLENLNVLRGDDVGVFALGYGIATTDEFVAENRDTLLRFLRATARGWQDALADPQEAAEITLLYNPDLDLESQLGQVAGMTAIMCDGIELNPDTGWGFSNPDDVETTAALVRTAGEIDDDLDVASAYTNDLWDELDAELLRLPCA